jgi:hypothetical protein
MIDVSETRRLVRFAYIAMVAGMTAAASLPATAALVVLNPVADTFITNGSLNGASPDASYGAMSALMAAGSSSGNGGVYESLLRFDLSAAVAAFDLEYGAGAWQITDVTLRLAANVGVQGAVPNNLVFPTINGGAFAIAWISNDAWGETTATYNNFSPGATESLGSFQFVPPGNNVPIVWSLALGSAFVSDVVSGGAVSLWVTPGDATVSYLFNSRTFSNAANFPALSVTAIPEPSGIALIALGSLLLTASRRRPVRAL